MKISRFSEIDLARFVAQATDLSLEPSLERYRARGGSSWNYEPVRSRTGDLVGTVTPLYGRLDPVPWATLESQIASSCRYGSDQVRANTEVARVLHEEAQRRGWQAIGYPLGRMPIGSGESVRYWSDVVLADRSGVAFAPYFDFRRKFGAGADEIRRVIFSMQQVWIRDRHPDLADIRLAIASFSNDARRTLDIRYHHDQELLTFEELDQRVRIVYETWAKVLRGPALPKRRTGTDDAPDLFGDD